MRDVLLERKLKREDEMAPVRQKQISEANQYLEHQEWLDQPIPLAESLEHVFGKDPDEQIVGRALNDNIMGDIAKVMKINFDPSTRTFFSPKGTPITRRMFANSAPMIAGIVDAKTDPKKLMEDQLEKLEGKTDPESKAARKEIKSRINDPEQKWLLDAYDKQEIRLGALKGQITQIRGDVGVINDSMSRINRRRKEILANNLATKTLAAKHMRLKPGITAKDIADDWIRLGIEAKEISSDNRFSGAYNKHPDTGEPYTEAQITASENQWQLDQFRAAMIAAGVPIVEEKEPRKTTKGFKFDNRGKKKGRGKDKPSSTRSTLDRILRDTKAERENRKKEENRKFSRMGGRGTTGKAFSFRK
jgi:hypothetical protein